MEPPCRSTTRRQIASPSPRPSYDGWARWCSSKTRSSAPGGSPTPWSATAIATVPESVRRPVTVMRGSSPGAHELEGVAEQVVEDLADQRGVRAHLRDVAHLHLVGGPVVGRHLLGQRRHVDAAQLEGGVLGRPAEQVLDEGGHPARAAADPVDVLLEEAGLDLAVLELGRHHLGPALHGGQRVAEVVGHHLGERREVHAPGVLDGGVAEDQQRAGPAGVAVAGQRGRGDGQDPAGARRPGDDAARGRARCRPASASGQRVAGAGRRRQQCAQVTGQAADPGGGRVAQQPLAGVVDHGQPLGHRVDHGVEELGLVGHLARAFDQLERAGPGRSSSPVDRASPTEAVATTKNWTSSAFTIGSDSVNGPEPSSVAHDGEVPQHEQVQGVHQRAEPDPAPDQHAEDQEEQGRGVEDEHDDVHRDAREAGGHELEGAALPQPGPRTGLGEVVEEQQPGRGDQEDAADVASRSTAACRARCRGRPASSHTAITGTALATTPPVMQAR